MVTLYLTYAVALAIAAAIPGPGIAALVAQALSGNIRSAIWFLGGMAAGDLVYLTVAVVGLAAIAHMFAGAFIVIKMLGAAYLLYLAYKFWTSDATMSEIQTRKKRGGFAAFLTGFMVTLGNPKTVIFYLALLPTVLNLEAIHLSEWATLTLVTVVVLYAVLFPYALMAAKARNMFYKPAALQRLNRIASCTIGGAGALILGEAAVAALRRS